LAKTSIHPGNSGAGDISNGIDQVSRCVQVIKLVTLIIIWFLPQVLSIYKNLSLPKTTPTANTSVEPDINLNGFFSDSDDWWSQTDSVFLLWFEMTMI
jgi:hypothetical protein